MVSQFDQLCDENRFHELVRLGFHETSPNKRFDELAKVASESIPAPVVLVSFVLGDCQVFKGAVGLQVPFSQDRNTPLSHSFCKYVVASGIPLLVHDARNHPELCTNGAIAISVLLPYMGFPIRSKSNVILGSFCAIDGSKRNWTAEEQSTAFKFSEIINGEITTGTSNSSSVCTFPLRVILTSSFCHRWLWYMTRLAPITHTFGTNSQLSCSPFTDRIFCINNLG